MMTTKEKHSFQGHYVHYFLRFPLLIPYLCMLPDRPTYRVCLKNLHTSSWVCQTGRITIVSAKLTYMGYLKMWPISILRINKPRFEIPHKEYTWTCINPSLVNTLWRNDARRHSMPINTVATTLIVDKPKVSLVGDGGKRSARSKPIS